MMTLSFGLIKSIALLVSAFGNHVSIIGLGIAKK